MVQPNGIHTGLLERYVSRETLAIYESESIRESNLCSH